MRTKKIHNSTGKLIATIVTVFVLFVIIVSMIRYVYIFAEEMAFEQLHMETLQIKRDINLQMQTNHETLKAIGDFVLKLRERGETYDSLFESFTKVGLFDNLGLFFPDGILVTGRGSTDLNGILSFEEEVKKGEYISGKETDLTNQAREIVRVSIPIRDNGEPVAILYGIINLNSLRNKYYADAKRLKADLYVLEGKNGDYIINTTKSSGGNPGNITEIANSVFMDGFSYRDLLTDLTTGENGYSSFVFQKTKEQVYVHYAPLNFGDWQIMLVKPASVVFSGAKSTGAYITTITILIIAILFCYILFIFLTDNKKMKMNINASNIRKSLLNVNQDATMIRKSLQQITKFANARSAFFIDTYGEEFNYIVPELKNKLLENEDRCYFIDKIMLYAAKNRETSGINVRFFKLTPKKQLRKEMPDFCSFLTEHQIKSIYFTVVTHTDNNTSLLGVINPKKTYVEELLKKVSVCFKMAIYNKKYLTKTENLALTDALTGIDNRMAYKQQKKKNAFNKEITCIYIDVNELSYYNNHYGHSAGDQMLIFISDTLRNTFNESKIFRMGGDEFLIIVPNTDSELIDQKLATVDRLVEEMNYHISVGVMYRESAEILLDELVNEAEKKMYQKKVEYYQNKGLQKEHEYAERSYYSVTTGNKELDACLSVMKKRYSAIYYVSLDDDFATKIIAPDYDASTKNEETFTSFMKRYIREFVKPEYRRTMLNFLNYDILKEKIKDGKMISINYEEYNGEKSILKIYSVNDTGNKEQDSLWVFEKMH